MVSVKLPPRPYLRALGQENPIMGPGGNVVTGGERIVTDPASELAVPELETWDAHGDVYVPDNAGAVQFVPALEAAPPQLPNPLQRRVPLEFEPHGLEAFVSLATDTLLRQLGFTAHTVLVDNLSSKWVYLPSARRWAPPNTVGIVMTLMSGTQVAQFTQTTPAGHVDGTNGASGPITTVWYEDYFPSAPGVTVLT